MSPGGKNDEVVALLKSFVKQHAADNNPFKGGAKAALVGFGESLEKLPPKTVVEFFKFQLEQGNIFEIGWAYMGLLSPRDPSKFSIFTELKPYSPALEKELKANAIDLLRLMANRDKVDSLDYLLQFIIERLLEDPTSDDADRCDQKCDVQV